jgi:prolyl oligopeptidase
VKARFLLPLIPLASACVTGAGSVHEGPPQAEKVAVSDTHHGIQVVEHYRWLEDWNDPRVQKWSDEQNVYARQVLTTLPNRAAIEKRVGEIMREEVRSQLAIAHAAGKLFVLEQQPPKQQPFLTVIDGVEKASEARTLLDPNVMDPTGKTHIDWFVPSAKGDLIAVSLSVAGTESGDVHVFDVATAKEVHEVIPGVNGGTAGGDLAWAPDGSGFYYTRYPRGEERPAEDMAFFQQLYFHQLGTPTEKDRYELGKDLPRIAEIQLDVHESGTLLATVQNGDGGEFAHFLRSPKGEWKQFTTFDAQIVQAAFGPNQDLYLLTRNGAPKGKILRVPIADLDVSKAETVIAEGEDTIVDDFWGPPTVLPTKSRLYVLYQLGGPSEIRVFDLKGQPLDKPEQLPVSAVGLITWIGGEDILFRMTSFTTPRAWFKYDAANKKTIKTALATTSMVDLSNVKVVREMATSKDGTKVPVNILIPPNAKLDGTDPCIVTGYGGYGVNVQPNFSATIDVLMQQGVIYAVTNLRGGGEFGEAWHRQGNLTNKQNVFDDFAASLQYLIEKKYTSSDRLGIVGGSNGGLLMGAVMTQHPELMHAVVSMVGIYDMLRVELSPNGSFNVPEFGTVKDEAHFKAMYSYSPYHRVKDGTSYPATLFMTGQNDPRVDPMQSRKMTARLQEANSGDAPIILRTTSDAGHGGGTALDERIAQIVDSYAFFFRYLGVGGAR